MCVHIYHICNCTEVLIHIAIQEGVNKLLQLSFHSYGDCLQVFVNTFNDDLRSFNTDQATGDL